MAPPAANLPPNAGPANEPPAALPLRVCVWLATTYFVLGGGAWLLAQNAAQEHWWLHGLWCFVGLAIAIPTLLRPLRQGFVLVLTDHRVMFLASFALYFLFGAALLAVGPENQIEGSQSYYPIGAKDALRTDAVNGLGFGIALLAASISPTRWVAMQGGRAAAQAARIPIHLVAGLFLVLGAMISVYLLPFQLGLVDGFPPGVLGSLGLLSIVAIFLVAAHRGRAERPMRTAGVVLAMMLALFGLLTFSKTSTLMPLAALTSGLAIRYGALRVLPLGLAALVTIFMVSGNIVNYGRDTIGPHGVASLAQRWQYLQDGWTATREYSEDEEYASWSRLCYTVPQAAALDLFDAGQGGDGMELMWWVPVPRMIYPDKPEISKVGRELTEKINGADSSTSPGIFASGYYHGGWLGFLFASAFCGWVLAQTSAIARAVQRNDALLLLPFSLLGLHTAFSIDGDFVPTYVGTFAVFLYPILAFTLLAPTAVSTRRQWSGQP